jgi:hypothetical protein
MPSYEKIIERQAQEAAEEQAKERERVARERVDAAKRAVYVQFWHRLSRWYCHRNLSLTGFPDCTRDTVQTLESLAQEWVKVHSVGLQIPDGISPLEALEVAMRHAPAMPDPWGSVPRSRDMSKPFRY